MGPRSLGATMLCLWGLTDDGGVGRGHTLESSQDTRRGWARKLNARGPMHSSLGPGLPGGHRLWDVQGGCSLSIPP